MNVITSYPIVVNNKQVTHPYYLNADGYSNAFGDKLKGLVGSGKVKGLVGSLMNKGGQGASSIDNNTPPPTPPQPKGMSKGLKMGLIIGGSVIGLGIIALVIYKTRKK